MKFNGYLGLSEYQHQFVNHLEKYVDGQIHTQGMENFLALLKRGLGGTYISVEPFHLFRYVDEQAYRYNMRKDDFGNKISDGMRFADAFVSNWRSSSHVLSVNGQRTIAAPRTDRGGDGGAVLALVGAFLLVGVINLRPFFLGPIAVLGTFEKCYHAAFKVL